MKVSRRGLASSFTTTSGDKITTQYRWEDVTYISLKKESAEYSTKIFIGLRDRKPAWVNFDSDEEAEIAYDLWVEWMTADDTQATNPQAPRAQTPRAPAKSYADPTTASGLPADFDDDDIPF